MRKHLPVILTGAAVGLAAIVLTKLGNPANMGFCIACFLRDMAGACALHGAAAVQYMRPEIAGLVLGAALVAVAKKEFRPRGGSAPLTRFVIAVFVMVGALVFLGCPLRMMLRIGGGDLNALVGLAGFISGVWIGTLWLKGGFTLGRAYPQPLFEGAAFSASLLALLGLSILFPALFKVTEAGQGPGGMHAALPVALMIGLCVGALCQRSRFCCVAASRDAMLFGDFHMLWGFVAVIVVSIVGNLLLGTFHIRFLKQPVAHTDELWNFLGMMLVGWGSVLLGGCPLRQLILAGEGNSDSAVTVTGFIAGTALCHNLGLASSTNGATRPGMIAVIAGLAVLSVISVLNRGREW